MASEKKRKVMEDLPEELHEPFEALVEQYRFQSTRVHGRAFVSYEVLAGLVRDGWRPSADAIDD